MYRRGMPAKKSVRKKPFVRVGDQSSGHVVLTGEFGLLSLFVVDRRGLFTFVSRKDSHGREPTLQMYIPDDDAAKTLLAILKAAKFPRDPTY